MGAPHQPHSPTARHDNNQFIFNRIRKARYGLATRGSQPTNNESGNYRQHHPPTSFGSDEIGKAGVFCKQDTGALVSRTRLVRRRGSRYTTAGADRWYLIVEENWTVTVDDYYQWRLHSHQECDPRHYRRKNFLVHRYQTWYHPRRGGNK